MKTISFKMKLKIGSFDEFLVKIVKFNCTSHKPLASLYLAHIGHKCNIVDNRCNHLISIKINT